MKRLVRVAGIIALAAAAPAIALPNAFWTFGWGVPGRSKPWTIGRIEDRRALRLAASGDRAGTEKAMAAEGSVAVFAYAPVAPALPVFAIEPVSAAVLARVGQHGDRSADPVDLAAAGSDVQPTATIPVPMPEPILSYDLAGL